MATLLLNSIALDPNRWTATKEPYFTLADLLPRVVEAGFRDLEIWQHHMSWLSDSEFAKLLSAAGELGVTFPIAGIYPAFHLEGDDATREWENLAGVVERSREAGARQVKIFAGAIGSAVADGSGARERSMDFAHRFVNLVNSVGMGINVETHPDTLCDSVSATREFLATFSSSDIAVCFQPYDFGSTEQTIADFNVLREHVRHVHLQGRRHDKMCLLADADIDYASVFKAFSHAGFDGTLSIEFVEGGVVERPADIDLNLVFRNAKADRLSVGTWCADAGIMLER